MNTFILYLVCFLPVLLIVGAYALLKFVWQKNIKSYDVILKWFVRILSIVSGVLLFLVIYHCPGIMRTKGGDTAGSLNPNVGCLNLVGEPYGDAKAGNFFAWLSIALLYPTAAIIIAETFLPMKAGKLINKFFGLPVIGLLAITLFNTKNAILGVNVFDYRSIFIALLLGFLLPLSVIKFIEDFKVENPKKWQEIVHTVIFYLLIFVCFLPSYTLATLFNTNGMFLGQKQTVLRVYDFTVAHRFFLYMTIAIPMVIYFTNRNQDLNTRKVMLILGSLGALTVYLSENCAHDVFPITDGVLKVSVNSLPFHLCHTALFVVPICVAFKLKRVFYFTYFINVFGALMAMFWPNTGEYQNIFNPSVIQFWYNHISALCAPLLCVALKVFERPKFKQMLWSLLFFAIYFFGVMVLNGWLSNYVDGYDPEKLGSGTDYLFLNGDYILKSVFGESSLKLIDVKLHWSWGSLVFVYYPLYQFLFFISYTGIAFAVWFVYSLFFRIADSHYDLHCRIKVMNSEHIKLRERLRMEKSLTDVNLHEEATLKFIDFCKRYGNSTRLSADHVNLEVKGGQIFGFLGPNGAGKSTCIKTTIGIQPVTEGRIEVCGYDVSTQSVQSKKCIGYVPDHYALYEKLTGREYINYIADLYGVSKEDRDLRIAKYIDLFELNQAFDNRMQTYSHGMKQKMTIMAALVHNPKVWILDEPLTGLDPQSIYQVKECMKDHASKGNIVFFSSHIIDVVEKLCTDIAIIKKGQIVYQNTMKKVLEEHPEGLEEFYMNTIRDNGDLDEE